MKDYIRKQGIGILEKVPLPERAVAARAGVITYGKNNFAYVDGYGSFVILHSIVLDTPLETVCLNPTCKCPPGCTRCIDACPTHAIASPGHLIPHRCIGYNCWWTPDIPNKIRKCMGQHLYGCDVCQEVCPRNHRTLHSASQTDPFLEMLADEFDLEKILSMNDEYYDAVVRPIMYNYIKELRYFRRNAAIAMGNSGDVRYLYSLRQALHDPDEMVSEAAKWAFDRIIFLQKNVLSERNQTHESMLLHQNPKSCK